MSQTHMVFDFNNEYVPDVVSAPGDTLQEIISDRQMTQTDLAERLGLTHKTVNEMIRGKGPISQETALALETVLGVPASYWNNAETAYRAHLARITGELRLDEYSGWLNRLPWREAVKLKWIRSLQSPRAQVLEVLRFFGVASPKQYDEVYGRLAIQWKRSANHNSNPDAVAFWLRRGEIEAAKLANAPGFVWNDFDAREFESCLLALRELTTDRDPQSFVPRLQARCALAGVVVVFIPEIKGTCAGGATRWLSPTRALIQLSLRYKTNDTLWFYVFHEALHILKHPKKRTFIEADDKDSTADEEREADEFAQNLLIPPREFATLSRSDRPSKAEVERFATRIGIDAGIVVGRLQREKLIPPNWYNDLKQRYRWEIQ